MGMKIGESIGCIELMDSDGLPKAGICDGFKTFNGGQYGWCWASQATLTARVFIDCQDSVTHMRRPATTDVGLCDEHYREIVGREPGSVYQIG
jgi:hypothetical protein